MAEGNKLKKRTRVHLDQVKVVPGKGDQRKERQKKITVKKKKREYADVTCQMSNVKCQMSRTRLSRLRMQSMISSSSESCCTVTSTE